MKGRLPEGFETAPDFDTAEDHVGPSYYRKTPAGYECAFIPDEHNCNVNRVCNS